MAFQSGLGQSIKGKYKLPWSTPKPDTKKEADRHLSEARQKAKEILARGEKKEAEAGEAEKGITVEKKV